MNKALTTIITFCAILLVAQNANASTAFQTAPAPTENVDPFVAITFADLPEEVQRRIRRTLYLEGYRAHAIYQHRETKDIRVRAISNEASMVTFMFDQYGTYRPETS